MPESTTRLDAHDAATQARLEAAERVVGHRFTDPARLLCALTHSSAKRPDHPSNERLEFLGDSILGLVIAERLYALFPDQPEGELTRVKAAVVSAQSIGPRARACGLSRLVEVGGGFASEQNVSLSMCADLFEAVPMLTEELKGLLAD